MHKLQIPLFTFQKSPYCETQKRCVLAQPRAETMSSSTTTSQNEGKSTNRKRLQALLLAWYILCWGEAAPHSGTCSFPGTHEHIHDPWERALTMSLAPMWCTQQVTVTISITANVLAFIYIYNILAEKYPLMHTCKHIQCIHFLRIYFLFTYWGKVFKTESLCVTLVVLELVL